MSTMADRLREARESAGYRSAAEAARILDIPEPTYTAHENGSRGFRATSATRYARMFKTTPEWLLFGKVPKADIPAEIVTFDASGSTLVPVYDVEASAGFGAVVHSEEVVASMAFQPHFLREMTDAPASALAVIRVKGHSMEPTLLDDDHVLIDRTKTNLDYDGLFVLRFGEALHVKRIGRAAQRGHVMVLSDHPSYRPVEMPKSEIETIGRVIWYGRKV